MTSDAVATAQAAVKAPHNRAAQRRAARDDEAQAKRRARQYSGPLTEVESFALLSMLAVAVDEAGGFVQVPLEVFSNPSGRQVVVEDGGDGWVSLRTVAARAEAEEGAG